ncbi:transporter family-2 protein [Anaerosolibacter carboniphilus]|uniref:Transporter family-2 protein n=1 Tax=Anaerosolibacter carboniphilus TaxID=1417629 RepID=A0A841L1J4_9FIRM|nr:DMT family transporter [Anaerosolibacter carboniphilus]MBB6216235.1 transporter family-2 protein [Anaerosolibacter carboniphilus]
MGKIIPILFAILAGFFTTIEATINVKLGRIVSPKIATLHNLITGLLVILVANLLKGTIHEYKKIIHVEPLWLIGGIFGTLIVYMGIKAIPKLGVANTLTIIVASQIVSGLIVDAFILKQQCLYLCKLFGILFLLLGTYLIVK